MCGVQSITNASETIDYIEGIDAELETMEEEEQATAMLERLEGMSGATVEIKKVTIAGICISVSMLLLSATTCVMDPR